MDPSTESKKIVDEVFSATGVKMSPDDPLVIAALFYSQRLRQAGDAVSSNLEMVAADIRAAAVTAMPDSDFSEVARTKLMRDIELRIVRCIKTASAGGGRNAHPYVPAWCALVGAVAGAVLIAGAWIAGIERGSVQADEAAVGRSFARVVSKIDPKLRAELMEQLRGTHD